MSARQLFVTNALPYANGPLHIGHLAGAYIPADIFVRYLRLKKKDVVYICGSDEHGAAITIKDRALSAIASPQSRPIENRWALEQLVAEAERAAGGADPARPAHWGGYLLRPDEVEFWQGQVGRLHDRFRYTREAAGWRIERLAP